MKLWRVTIYNHFGDLVNSWLYSSREDAKEHGEDWTDRIEGSYKVVYAGVHPCTISASDKSVIFPFDAKSSNNETIYFESFDEFKEVLREVGATFKGRF